MALLSSQALRSRLAAIPPLIEGALDVEVQVQPNGFDLTLREVYRYTSGGRIDFSNAKRDLSGLEMLPLQSGGWQLAQGSYLVTFNEIVHIPLDLAALGRTRSSLLRCGASLQTAVWDAGYSGRSQSLLVIHNPAGLLLERNARILQLVFYELTALAAQGYQGRFQGEDVVR